MPRVYTFLQVLRATISIFFYSKHSIQYVIKSFKASTESYSLSQREFINLWKTLIYYVRKSLRFIWEIVYKNLIEGVRCVIECHSIFTVHVLYLILFTYAIV